MKTITYAVIIRKSGERIETPHLIGREVHNVECFRKALYPTIECWHGERLVYNVMDKKWYEQWNLDFKTVDT